MDKEQRTIMKKFFFYRIANNIEFAVSSPQAFLNKVKMKFSVKTMPLILQYSPIQIDVEPTVRL